MKLKKLISGITSLALSLTAFAGIGRAVPYSDIKADAAQTWKFDLGGNGAASGFTGVSASDGYNSSRGYGFAQTGNVANVSASGSGANSDAVQFKSTSGSNTFDVDLPYGLYEIKVTTGNTTRTSIAAEGMLQLINLTGNNAVDTFQIPVTDGRLNIMATAGKDNTAFSISAIEITQLNTTGATNPTVWICGDSTVANYYNTSDSAQHGWGQFFGDYIKDSGYIIRNMAASGQYAKGFVDAGQFKPIETYGKSGDYYIISIGINDTNYSNNTEYYNTVTDMVKRSKAKGMEVILVKQQGRRADLNRSPRLSGRWFGGELDKIGSEQNVQVVDLFTEWQNFGFSVGYDGMASYYATQANGSADDLHQSKKGAQKLAEIMSGLVSIGSDIEPVEPFIPENGVSYMFRNVNSGLYMEVEGARAEADANVQQWGASAPAAHNTWTIKQATGEYYYIYSNLGDGNTFLLNVDQGSRVSGGNIVSTTINGYSDQFFAFNTNRDGSVTILTRASRDACAIEVASASTSSGANIQQWEVNGNDCQKWIIEKVNYSSAVVTTTTTTTTAPVTTTTTTVITEPRIKKFPGNANCDSNVSMADAVLIMQSISNPDKFGEEGSDPSHITVQGKINADVTGSGDGVTPADALYVQRALLEIVKLPEIEYYEADPVPVTTTTTVPADPYAGYYFAVDQTWSEGVIEETNGGFTKTAGVGSSDKTGYINLDNNNSSFITFTVNAESAGNYMTHIRFANGSDTDRSMIISVNGRTDMTWLQSFPGTGAWTNWTEYGIVLPLNAGQNTIRMLSNVAGQGGPNLDYITISLTDEPYAEVYDPSKQQQQTVSDKPTIYIAGDSTAQSYGANYAPQQGWGYYAGSYFNDNVTVVNRSIAGRSSKKFYDEGRFKSITDSLKAGDFVFIQFAINDAGASNADRYAPTCGNVNNPSSGSYEWYMTQFINDTLAKGATPVLMSCTLSAKSYSNGRFNASYTNYTDACKQLASKYNVPFVDVNGVMVNHYNSVGYDKAVSYHLAGVVQGSTDMTHFNENGANVIAGLIANAVKSANISGLSSYVK